MLAPWTAVLDLDHVPREPARHTPRSRAPPFSDAGGGSTAAKDVLQISTGARNAGTVGTAVAHTWLVYSWSVAGGVVAGQGARLTAGPLRRGPKAWCVDGWAGERAGGGPGGARCRQASAAPRGRARKHGGAGSPHSAWHRGRVVARRTFLYFGCSNVRVTTTLAVLVISLFETTCGRSG